jgi:hypothetical protein
MTPAPDTAMVKPAPAIAAAQVEHAAGHKNMLQLIELRSTTSGCHWSKCWKYSSS